MSDPAAPSSAATPRATWAKITLFGALGLTFGTINIAIRSEPPALMLAILGYVALGLGAVAFVGGVIGLISAK